MIGSIARHVDLELVAQIEAHSVRAWPPLVVEHVDGWTLRAMPGLHRGRSNHALTPCRTLSSAELDDGIAIAMDFAARHGIERGLQISPLDLHAVSVAELAERGWEVQPSVQVLTVALENPTIASGPKLELTITDHADEEWLAAWAHCEPHRAAGGPGLDVASHVQTVFPLMAGRAQFCRFGQSAVGVAVSDDDLVGLFCIAVDPQARRQGFGKALMRSMLEVSTGSLAYLQVFSENLPGIALYTSLGFDQAYGYRHCVAPTTP